MVTKFQRNFRLTIRNYSSYFSFLQKQTAPTMKKVGNKQSSTKAGQPTDFLQTNATAKVEILPSPVKSFSDKKEYKVIRLENGLTACLVSDMSGVTDVSSILHHDSSSESEESDTEGSTESDSDSEDSAGSDGRDEDEIKPKKVHDEVKLAAAALCVGVGSFSDPKEVPGLAHFVEHMVFMGSEKFPQENDFDAFIKKHGGSDNASTDYETTTFYFECFEKHLYQAMDKFANFFIAPLMKRESMTRERESIESEFQLAVPSDDHRKEQLLASLAESSSPVNSFAWGNLTTLKHNISDDALYEKSHEFRKRHYSAHRMTLAVQARLPIEILESYVINCFSAVPSNNLPPSDFKQYSEAVFHTPQFRRTYYVKPVKDVCQVDLTWVMPSLQHMYKSKPHVYVSWLLGHEGKGSLLSYLKKKVWALTLYAGNGESGVEFNSIYASFSVNIVLTLQGFLHLKEVIKAVYSYINMLKKVGPSEKIFREIQSIEETSFRFKEDESASDNVEDLVECMHYYPSEDYLVGSELFFDYDPDGINMVLDNLVPHKMNVQVLTTTLPKDVVYDKVEPWFKTQYTDKEIPTKSLDSWANAKPLPEFALPEPNPFLTEDFSLLPEENIPEYPEKIITSSMVELWYRKDQKFELPIAYYYYYLITHLSMDSAESACMIQMFVEFVNMNLAEEGYPAQIAELSYEISPCEKGICIKVSGFNEKLPMLIGLIAKYLRSVYPNLTKEVFEAVKEKQKKSFYNGLLKPSKLSKDLRLTVLQSTYYSLQKRHTAISSLKYDTMKKFSKELLKKLYVQGLIQGNVTADTAFKTTEEFVKKLQCEPLPESEQPLIVINMLPQGEHCIRVKSYNEDSRNSIVTNYYQCGVLTIPDNIILEFIMLIIEEPLFDILRTKEQLGYSVYCSLRDTYGILGYSITVNTQADKFTVDHVDNRIEAFLKHSNKLMKRMTDKKFAQTKNDLIKVKKVVDVDLEDEADRNWGEIVYRTYMFDRLAEEISTIEQLRIGEVKKWWDEHNKYSKKDLFRKLSVQVVGHSVTTPENKIFETEESKSTNVEQTADGAMDTSVSKIETESHIKHIYDLNAHTETEEVVKVVTVISGQSEAMELPENSTPSTPNEEHVDEELALKLIDDGTSTDKTSSYFITDIDGFKKQLKVYYTATKI